MSLVWSDKDGVIAMLEAIPNDPPSPQPPTGGGAGIWAIDGLRAANDPAALTTAMMMSAEAVAFFDASTNAVIPRLSVGPLSCSIATYGVGGRDQSTPFAAGDDVWFYFILDGGTVINSICSKQRPAIGPRISQKTPYCPAFPLKIWAGPTIHPLLPQGGASPINVRGRTVGYRNAPDIIGVGYPQMNFDFSPWVPKCAAEIKLWMDGEMKVGVAPMIGGIAYGTPDGAGNFGNQSHYGYTGQHWIAMDTAQDVMLADDRLAYAYFLFSAGSTDNAVCHIMLNGYTF